MSPLIPQAITSDLDKILDIIKKSNDSNAAKENLKKKKWLITKDLLKIEKKINELNDANINSEYSFSDMQVKAILDLRLHRLTSLERE